MSSVPLQPPDVPKSVLKLRERQKRRRKKLAKFSGVVSVLLDQPSRRSEPAAVRRGMQMSRLARESGVTL